MKKRMRKKWLKQHGKYVNPSDTWDLYYTISEFILPRLKMFKKKTNGNPVRDGINTFEDWQKCLDKMILAFEYIVQGDDWWMWNPKFDYVSHYNYRTEPIEDGMRKLVIDKTEEGMAIEAAHNAEELRRQGVIDEGLMLFCKYFQDLWW